MTEFEEMAELFRRIGVSAAIEPEKSAIRFRNITYKFDLEGNFKETWEQASKNKQLVWPSTRRTQG
jgi:hypothetical protein